ncbi:MAG: pyridoxamine 5-phosphate oxidase-related, FMN-binding protein, partial [Nocardioidaceae bacterium]|nr:pyridoxamine 5-phosphate oxidase-related, FMN-binding protein [Nocardioidaceae bacterium]
FRTSPYSTLGTYARNATLAFEVGGIADGAHLASSVVAVGRAHIVDDADEMQRLTRNRNPEPWGDPRHSTYFSMPWSELSGRRIRVDGWNVGSAAGA